MNDQVSWITRLNQRIIENLTEERSGLLRQLDELRKQSDDIHKNLSVLDAKKDQIISAQKLQIELLNSTYGFDPVNSGIQDEDFEQEETSTASGLVKEIGRLKARIGDQRYQILEVFRSVGAATVSFAVFRTKLPERRVRDAIVADLGLGVLEKKAFTSDGDDVVALTEVGIDLMRRFDDYRRQKGLPLPSLPDLDKPNDFVIGESNLAHGHQQTEEADSSNSSAKSGEMLKA